MSKLTDDKIKDIYYNEYLKDVAAYILEEKYELYKGYLYRHFNRLGLPLRSNSINSKKHTFNENYFEVIDSEDKAY